MKISKKIANALLVTTLALTLTACGAPRVIVKRTPLPALPSAPTIPSLSTFKPVEIVATYQDGSQQTLRAMDEDDFRKIMKQLREQSAWIEAVRKLHGEKTRKAPKKPEPPKRLIKPI